MYRLLFFFGLGVLIGLPSAAGQSPADVDAATEAYRQEQYARAASMYEALLSTSQAGPALYYNLANAYVRTDRLGKAIQYYEKARRLRPGDPRIRHNLEQARRRAGVYPEQMRQVPRGLPAVVQYWSPLALLIGGVLLLSSGLVVAVVWTRPDRPRAVRHPLVWGPVAAGLLLAVTAMGTSYLQSNERYAIVVTDRAKLHRTPSSEAAVDTTLPEGGMLKIEQRTPEWNAVRLSDGTGGWVPTRTLGGI